MRLKIIGFHYRKGLGTMKSIAPFLKKYGMKQESGMTFFALAETQEELEKLHYTLVDSINKDSIHAAYFGAKLTEGVICYAASSDKEILEQLGYDVLPKNESIIHHSVYLW